MNNHKYPPHFFGIIALLILSLIIFFYFVEDVQSNLKIIDIHEHIQTMEKADILAQVNADLNIEQTVLLVSPIETITLNGNKSFTRYIENANTILGITQKYPDKFHLFCTVNPHDDNALEYIQTCIENGGKGIKLYNGHSYYYEIFDIPLDSEKMLPIYAYAEENSIPILFHINISKYMDELESILERHPNLRMNVPHFMVSSIKLDRVAGLLDKYPNLYTDISFGSPEFLAAGLRRISNDNDKYIEFIEKYSDRVLFGSDMVITDVDFKDYDYMKDTLQCYKNILEKKYFKCDRVNEYYKKEVNRYKESFKNCKPKEGKYCISAEEKLESRTRWYNETKILNGLNLKSSLLQKIYWDNPLRFLNGESS